MAAPLFGVSDHGVASFSVGRWTLSVGRFPSEFEFIPYEKWNDFLHG